MCGISGKDRKETASRLMRQASSVGFLFNVVLGEHCAHLFREQWRANSRLDDDLTFTRPTQTGIECQQDMLRGSDKSYTCICDAAVIAHLSCAKGGSG